MRHFQLPTWKVLWYAPRKKTKQLFQKITNQQQPEKPERSEMTNLLAPSYEKDEAKAVWHNHIKLTASLAFYNRKIESMVLPSQCFHMWGWFARY